MTPQYSAIALANAESRMPSMNERLVTEDLNLNGYDETRLGLTSGAFLPAHQDFSFDFSWLAGLFTRRQMRHA
jgi:hypothetical protein